MIAAAEADHGVTFTVAREGARHTVYDDLDGITISIARQNEIGNRMAEVTCKEAAAKLGKDWRKK